MRSQHTLRSVAFRAARCIAVGVAIISLYSVRVQAQETRSEEIAAKQKEKAQKLEPYQPSRFERVMARLEENLASPPNGFFPAFGSVYPGGGFTPGVGYRRFYGRHSVWDIVGLYSIKNYKQVEVGNRGHPGTAPADGI